jgi:5-enolpyruvylshikimate-3-phosphate synthase
MNDYRIGMSVAAAALLAVGCGTVKEPACVQFCESEITVACY